MLGDLLLLVGTPGGRGGVGGGNLVLDGTVGACTGDQLAGADVLIGAPLEVVCLTDVDEIPLAVADAVLPGTGRGLRSDTGAGIVFGGATRFVDGHTQLLSQGFRLGAHGLMTLGRRATVMEDWDFRQYLQQWPNCPAVGLNGMGLPQRRQLR